MPSPVPLQEALAVWRDSWLRSRRVPRAFRLAASSLLERSYSRSLQRFVEGVTTTIQVLRRTSRCQPKRVCGRTGLRQRGLRCRVRRSPGSLWGSVSGGGGDSYTRGSYAESPLGRSSSRSGFGGGSACRVRPCTTIGCLFLQAECRGATGVRSCALNLWAILITKNLWGAFIRLAGRSLISCGPRSGCRWSGGRLSSVCGRA